MVLQRELYAVPALLGAGVVVVGDGLDLPRQPVALTAAVVVFTVRMVGHWLGWQAPVAPLHRPDRGSP